MRMMWVNGTAINPSKVVSIEPRSSANKGSNWGCTVFCEGDISFFVKEVTAANMAREWRDCMNADLPGVEG